MEYVAQEHPEAGITRTMAHPPDYELPANRSPAKQALVRECAARDDVNDVRPIIEALEWLESNIQGRAEQPPLPPTNGPGGEPNA